LFENAQVTGTCAKYALPETKTTDQKKVLYKQLIAAGLMLVKTQHC
jgi:hypothetical protein